MNEVWNMGLYSSSGYFWVTSHKTPGISEGFGVRNSFFPSGNLPATNGG